MKTYTIDWTFDRVVMLLLDMPHVTVPQMKEIATQVSDITDRAAKDAKIRELAAALPVADEEPLAKTA